MNMHPLEALRISVAYHYGQYDWYGVPYSEHPRNVAINLMGMPEYEMLTDEEQQRGLCAAYLHDTVEDTDMTLPKLAELGAEPELCSLVDALTHREDEGETLQSYYDRIVTEGRLACLIKLADLQHNSNPDRIESLDEETKTKMLNKYVYAETYIRERM